MLSKKHAFPSAERLKRKKEIQELFAKGSSFFLYPYKIIYLTNNESGTSLPKVLFSVSKKYDARTVQRNLLRRRIKEAYRLSKSILASQPHRLKAIAFISVAKQPETFEFLSRKMKELLHKLLREHSTKDHLTN
ncbi:MAG: ribonuclease P protein component [Flammeovirgaceae bacterium]|nr:ribonuclease P protein component [Flammeovirgaceae bacterium]MDW8287686.1 ribonuclease P protein component [Flammeovirgaceae bacterium]